MAVYIQHGHGRSDKITTALDARSVDGVIFGARNEKPDNLLAYIKPIRSDYKDCELLFDPQFYVSTLTPPNDRYLPEYPYYESGRSASDFTGVRRVRRYAEDTLKFQVDMGVSALLSPTVIFDSFSDRWHQIALNLADASLEYHTGLTAPPPLLLSFVLDEKALAAADEVNRFLDAVTQDEWHVKGFYFIVDRREKTYNQRVESSCLAQYLYLVYVLSQLNDLRVICGYTDFVGIPLRAAGAHAFATGWHHSLRQFHRGNFIKRRPGGQPARERYSSGPLFNSILMNELQDIFEVGQLNEVLSNVLLDDIIMSASNPEGANWTKGVSQQHHWQSLGAMDERLSGNVKTDLSNTIRWLRDADGLYKQLAAEGVQFDRNSGRDHIEGWLKAIGEFQQMARPTSS
ncbi:MAG: hypothetical protein JW959_09085 [Pirellulales bacterium]|nr:hypothetical protein [Pirellulales bacterium]